MGYALIVAGVGLALLIATAGKGRCQAQSPRAMAQ
jgi:hypothetical protein